MDLGHWETGAEIPDAPPFGFVYRITNLQTGQYYIGKKQCYSAKKKKPLKGRKNARRYVTESDWRSYTGSCKRLNQDIAMIGAVNFRFEILEWTSSKWESAYRELEHQMEQDVLRDPMAYNGIINVRLTKRTNDGTI